MPVDDSSQDDIQEFFDQVADKINEKTIEKVNVVVHCVAGVSRSTSLVLAYLMKYQKMDLHTAFSYTHSKRPVIRPNNGFFRQLLNYEMKIFGKNSCKMIQLHVNGFDIEVPDFFQSEHKGFLILESLKEKSKHESKMAGKDFKKQEEALTPQANPQTNPPPALSNLEQNLSNALQSPVLSEAEAEKAALSEDIKKENLLKRFVIGNDAKIDNEMIIDIREEKIANVDKDNKKDKK